MTFAVAVLLVAQMPWTQLLPPKNALAIVNGEQTGHIEAVVNGRTIMKTFERLAGAKPEKAASSRNAIVWQAGPGDAIVITRRNWTTSSDDLAVYVRYFSDGDALIGVSRAHHFRLTGDAPAQKWVFSQSDLVK